MPTSQRMTKVSPDVLEAMWIAASNRGQDAALELGDPTIDVLVVNGKDVAYSAKPERAA